MKRSILVGVFGLVLFSAVAAPAKLSQKIRGDAYLLHGKPTVTGTPSPADTVYVLGGFNKTCYNSSSWVAGSFQISGTEHAGGVADWHGWTSQDRTREKPHYWSVTDDPQLACVGNQSLWVGDFFPRCATDPGYGNNWREAVVYTYTVGDPNLVSDVQWRFRICHETEPGYDWVKAQYNLGGTWITQHQWDGIGVSDFDEIFTYLPGEYVGPSVNQIQLRIRFESDLSWSDEDGMWLTARGAAQIDDIEVYVNAALVEQEDFETLGPSLPGHAAAFNNWIPQVEPGVGDFAALYWALGGMDPCVSPANSSVQVAFIDDGIVVPGTGGTLGGWLYGPGGYVVNNTGGLLGGDAYLFNSVISPAIEVPATTCDGTPVEAMYLEFDVYCHEQLGPSAEWPGMFYQWEVRSVDTGDPGDLECAPWRNRNFVHYGGPVYLRSRFEISDLLEQGRTHLQVALSVIEYGWVWGWTGDQGAPAPYFDNVVVAGFPFAGPAIAARAIDLAQDNFPTTGTLDFFALANNWIRFAMARNSQPPGVPINSPGDSITADVQALGAGTTLAGLPRLYFAMQTNELFNAVRVTTDPRLKDLTVSATLVTGYVEGETPVSTPGGQAIRNRFSFGLPHEFFFPGDIIHYYFEARDSGAGVTRLPGDLTFFGDFSTLPGYDATFTVRGLPTMFSSTPGDQPKILFYNHFDIRGGDHHWLNALNMNGYVYGEDFDMYYTNGPSSNVGNALGGRATPDVLRYYDTLLYSSGDLSVNVLGVGDPFMNISDDVGLLTAWFAQGGKRAFMTGDGLATSLAAAGGAAAAFLADYLGGSYVAADVRPSIGGNDSPCVHVDVAATFWPVGRNWAALGSCSSGPTRRTFDHVVTAGGAIRLAHFVLRSNPCSDPNDAYAPIAAAIHNIEMNTGAEVIYLPYDFAAIVAPAILPWKAAGDSKTIPLRAQILAEVLEHFGHQGTGTPTTTAPAAVFAVGSFPNPFNPTVTLKLSLPRDGEISLSLYNARGELVRTLLRERLAAGVHDAVWDARDDRGARLASGVYFFEVRYGGETKVGKLVLLK